MSFFYVLRLFAVAAWLTLVACGPPVGRRLTPPDAPPLAYPSTYRDESIVDVYHGTEVKDPYRWLEADQSEATQDWVRRQRDFTELYFGRIPFREVFRRRLGEIWNYARYQPPYREGGKRYFFKNDGLQSQDVLYVQDTPESDPKVRLDPNAFSTDGTISLGTVHFNRTGDRLAFTVSEGGSDWRTALVMDLGTGKMLRDTIRWIKFSTLSWWKDGFFYGRYPAPEKGDELKGLLQHYRIYYHRLGTDQSADELIYEDRSNPDNYFYCSTSEDERFLLLHIMPFASGNAFYYKDLSRSADEWIPVATDYSSDFFLIDNHGDDLILLTNDGAPRYRIISVPTGQAEQRTWRDILPEGDDVIQEAYIAGGRLVVSFLHHAHSLLRIYDLEGDLLHTVELPSLGTVRKFSGHSPDSLLYFTFESFTFPAAVFELNVLTGKAVMHQMAGINFDPTAYETRQEWYPSIDGTRVPVFLVYKKGLRLDGKNPCLLFGYGAYNFSMTPQFNPANLLLLEQGGVFALANIRGGGEFGKAWHTAGAYHNKQRMIDDFIAAGEYLIGRQYTASPYLGIMGISNGGLLVGACLTQRPDLFKVCIPRVGVMDMLRYQLFTVGMAWSEEYGLSSNADDFEYLIRYSPLHRLRSAEYPATLVMTSDRDDRVVPAHSYKFIAELQYRQSGNLPALIRIDANSGHGAGKSTTQQIAESADMLAFFFYHTRASGPVTRLRRR